jgi:hypothetical protein
MNKQDGKQGGNQDGEQDGKGKQGGTPDKGTSSNMDIIYTPDSANNRSWIQRVISDLVKAFYPKNTSILANFQDEIESIRLFEYNLGDNSRPGLNFIGPEIRGRRIDGGSAYVIVYHFKPTDNYFWQPDMVEFLNYQGAMSIAMRLENAGWKIAKVDYKKEREEQAKISNLCKDCFAFANI